MLWAERVDDEAKAEGLLHCDLLERALLRKEDVHPTPRSGSTERSWRWTITNLAQEDQTQVLRFEPGSPQGLTTECLKCMRTVCSNHPLVRPDFNPVQRMSSVFTKLLVARDLDRAETLRLAQPSTRAGWQHIGTSIRDWLASASFEDPPSPACTLHSSDNTNMANPIIDTSVHNVFSWLARLPVNSTRIFGLDSANLALTSGPGFGDPSFSSVPGYSGSLPSSNLASDGGSQYVLQASEHFSENDSSKGSVRLSDKFPKLKKLFHRRRN